ncbi:MAG: M56 family metallopeptidase [Spirochaetales bacterium]|nr:M56 family metallopeptidase [Spirochaetales bacterium]
MRRSPAVLLSERCRVPFTFGIRRPVIVLPASAPGWSAVRTDSALTHELAHIRRWNMLTQSIADGVCLVFWFIPPLWLAYAAMLREAETCCDQQVINRGIRGSEYARNIVDLANSCHGRILLPCMSGPIGGRMMLKKRVQKVLSLKPGAASFGPKGVATVLAAFLCCLVPLLALTCATRPPVLEAEDPLVGTWVNEDYDKAQHVERHMVGRFVVFPDGRELGYRRIGDTDPVWDKRFVVEEPWIDAEGYRWYKMHWTSQGCSSGSDKVWSGNTLARINPAGTIWEAKYSGYGGYPDVTGFDPAGPGCSIMYRQQ